MTFNDLHDGIGSGCNCLDQEGVFENTEDFFARAITREALSIDDFKSYYEGGKVNRQKGCRAECRWRGVSVNKLKGNQADIKVKWESARLFSPQGPEPKNFVCTFRLRVGAGMLWDTSNNHSAAHHTLFKADGFSVASVEIKEIVPVTDF